MIHILAALQIAYVGCLFLGNEVQDMLLAEAFQYQIHLLRLEGTL
jgi:hypothetical protein